MASLFWGDIPGHARASPVRLIAGRGGGGFTGRDAAALRRAGTVAVAWPGLTRARADRARRGAGCHPATSTAVEPGMIDRRRPPTRSSSPTRTDLRAPAA